MTVLVARPEEPVVNALLSIVAQGRPGDRLPSERAIAAELRVGRAAVRRALSTLDEQALIVTRRQAGSFIR
jgi:DNA-binding GntR family transcriptional regulator